MLIIDLQLDNSIIKKIIQFKYNDYYKIIINDIGLTIIQNIDNSSNIIFFIDKDLFNKYYVYHNIEFITSNLNIITNINVELIMNQYISNYDILINKNIYDIYKFIQNNNYIINKDMNYIPDIFKNTPLKNNKITFLYSHNHNGYIYKTIYNNIIIYLNILS